MLELQSISKTFHPGTIHAKKALQNLSLSLNDGDFVTVIGGNGAGKSTMLNAVAGVWPVDSGRIILDGVDVTAMPEYRRAQYIGRVFQDPMMGTAPNMQMPTLRVFGNSISTMPRSAASAARRYFFNPSSHFPARASFISPPSIPASPARSPAPASGARRAPRFPRRRAPRGRE